LTDAGNEVGLQSISSDTGGSGKTFAELGKDC